MTCSAREERRAPTLQTAPEQFLQDRMFWVRYLKSGIDLRGCESLNRDGRQLYGPDLPDVRVALEFPHGFGLAVILFKSGHRLELTHPSLPASALLGWMDCQHMSDLLQREEFEGLVRHSDARSDPGREPWMTRLLLGFYVSPLREYDGWYAPMLRAAVSESGLFTTEEAAWVESYTRTLRTRSNRDFPFPLMQELLGAVGAW